MPEPHATRRQASVPAIGAALMWMHGHAAQACEARTTMAELSTVLEEAASTYDRLDRRGFQQSIGEARTVLACIDEPIPPEPAGRYQLLEGLFAFGAGSPEAAQRAFASARLAWPPLKLDIVPEGHPIYQTFKGASPKKTGGMTPLAGPENGTLLCNGAPCVARPKALNVVVQVVDATGTVHHTVLLQPEQDLPRFTLPGPSADSTQN